MATAVLEQATKDLKEKGFLDVTVDPTLDLFAEIEKLKKEKLYETKRISGALKQTINAHGPITSLLIGSATKRIYGALLSNGTHDIPYVKIHKATLTILLMLFILGLTVLAIL